MRMINYEKWYLLYCAQSLTCPKTLNLLATNADQGVVRDASKLEY
jgi:hypothetical protein